ncbi:hypothetical protein Q5752_006571 [Cryptotrichosporon argae]
MSLIGLRSARAATATTSALSIFGLPSTTSLTSSLGAVLAPCAGARRAASTRAAAGSIQAVDEQLERAARERSRQAGMVDYAALDVPVMERVVDPGLLRALRAGFRKGWGRYLQERAGRWRATADGLHALGIHRCLADPHRSGLMERLRAAFRPQVYAAQQLAEFARMYETYYRAQAAGDLAHVRAVSTGAALQAATKVASAAARAPMQWAIERAHPPRLVSARVHPIDPAGKVVVAQCVVRFESEQTLTLARKAAAPKRQRVVELVVFERHLNTSGAWKLKDKLEAQLPDYIKTHAA